MIRHIPLLPILILVVLFSYVITYQYGKHVSYVSVHSEWQKERANTERKMRELREEYRTYEDEYREEIQKLKNSLQDSQDSFNAELSNIRAEYSDRLLDSENRAYVYKRMSEAGASERRDLADHAARLDRSLEEGRALVQELRTTLRQREVELITLGSQIQADRTFLDKADKINE